MWRSRDKLVTLSVPDKVDLRGSEICAVEEAKLEHSAGQYRIAGRH